MYERKQIEMWLKFCIRKVIGECIWLSVLIVGAVVLGTVLTIFLYSLPTGRIYENARNSIPLYSTQMIGNWSGDASYTTLSNYSDSIMINNAVYRPYESNVDNAMLNSYIQYKGEGMNQNLVKFLTEGPDGGETVDYSRYWHGYLLYLIPGLAFFTVGEIKVLMMIVQMLLFALCLYEFGKIDFLYSALFTVVVLFINPVTTVLTFEDADIYIITMLFTFLILKKSEWLKQKERWKFIFALNGILVAYMDFFTYPLVAYGIPALTFLILEECWGKKAADIIVKSLFFWLSGYGGMWIGKWVMALLLTGNNTIADGVNAFKFRTAGEGSQTYTYRYVLSCIWDAVKEPPMLILFILIFLGIGIYIWKNNCSFSLSREQLSMVIPVLVIGILPFVYYFVVRNHTAIHPWLEYRELAVTVFSVGVCGIKLILTGTRQNSTGTA